MVFILFGVLWTCWIWLFMFLIINGRIFSLLHTLFSFCNSDCTLNDVCPQFCVLLLSLWESVWVLCIWHHLLASLSLILSVRCHDEPHEVILHCCCCGFIFSISIWHLDFLTPCWNASSVLLLCLLFPWELLIFVIITLNSYLESWCKLSLSLFLLLAFF